MNDDRTDTIKMEASFSADHDAIVVDLGELIHSMSAAQLEATIDAAERRLEKLQPDFERRIFKIEYWPCDEGTHLRKLIRDFVAQVKTDTVEVDDGGFGSEHVSLWGELSDTTIKAEIERIAESVE